MCITLRHVIQGNVVDASCSDTQGLGNVGLISMTLTSTAHTTPALTISAISWVVYRICRTASHRTQYDHGQKATFRNFMKVGHVTGQKVTIYNIDFYINLRGKMF